MLTKDMRELCRREKKIEKYSKKIGLPFKYANMDVLNPDDFKRIIDVEKMYHEQEDTKKKNFWVDEYGHDYRIPLGISIAGIVIVIIKSIIT